MPCSAFEGSSHGSKYNKNCNCCHVFVPFNQSAFYLHANSLSQNCVRVLGFSEECMKGHLSALPK